MRQKFIVGSFGIIKNEEGKILLVLRNDFDAWNLPGGAIEKGETPWEGVIREVKEETGFNVEVIRLIGIYTKKEKNHIIFSFECKIIDGEIRLNKEAKDIKYFDFNSIPKNTLIKHVERIHDYLYGSEELINKVQI